ncbi:hypothetical protein NK718_05940 [Alsobacter sp. SYSU M60028]|uniref:DUF1488 family protein n=1 Tax=Alsobacter ponti TaxID=2962936 RepID=A0ABT1L9C4_9HYPH|nr:hypothetical protein [Alsobacter ponti]MCP8938049.1 hypothetical protein [Alsobacter ponti]
MSDPRAPSSPADAAWLWRDDVDALAFRPPGRAGLCFVHRLAFRALLRAEPAPVACLAFFRRHAAAFEAAALAKASARALPDDANFHLTSRDVARRLTVAKAESTVEP